MSASPDARSHIDVRPVPLLLGGQLPALPHPPSRRGGRAGEYVVVTRETTTGIDTYAGLPPAYHVTLVTVQAVAAGWAVSAWQPQS